MLQHSMASINTVMLQQILSDPACCTRLKAADLRAQTPLFYLQVHPNAWFDLDLNKRLPIEWPMVA
jgi:hypothetical protein